MARDKKTKITYVTSSDHKKEENKVFVENCSLSDGSLISDQFEFEIIGIPILETLVVDLSEMVQAEATNAYSQIKVPCIVEHAGLIFEDFKDSSYPGGLTKPMWNTLEDRFLEETNSANRKVIAQAVVAYCDGKQVLTFVGETSGKFSEHPRGDRKFYWDTVFIPDDPSEKITDLTYAQIVADQLLGLKYKMKEFSQSAKAMIKFLEYIKKNGTSPLWRD